MRFFDIIKDANQNLLRNKLRTFLTILAIFIGSFSIISTSAIQAGVNDFIDSQVSSYGGEGYLAIVAKDSVTAISTMYNYLQTQSRENMIRNVSKLVVRRLRKSKLKNLNR